nr:hypothetical protein [uncultured Lachnoanaerobaculum sp.]
MINFTNHPYDMWDERQKETASMYGDIKEIPFPPVDPTYTEEQLDTMAGEYKEKILELNDKVVLLQGEFTLSFRLVNLLKKSLDVVAACSKRNVKEGKMMTENTIKRCCLNLCSLEDIK